MRRELLAAVQDGLARGGRELRAELEQAQRTTRTELQEWANRSQ